MEQAAEVVIVGAGLAGLATAVALQRVGIPSLVLERSHELRATGAAIGLFPNAWRALDALGVSLKLQPLSSPMEVGHVTNVVTGTQQEVSFTEIKIRNVASPRILHRKNLLNALAQELPPETIRFSSKLVSIKMAETQASQDQMSNGTILHLEDGTIIRTKVLIGCDGVHSVVAQWLGLSAPISSGRSGVRGLSVFPGGHRFEHGAHQFLSPDKRAGFVPLNDTDLYWFITHISIPTQAKESQGDPRLIQEEVLENLAKEFPDTYLQVVRHSDPDTITWAPLKLRVPWAVALAPACRGCVTVAGDAFHPMTPDLAQGGGSALEDAVVLARCIAGARPSLYAEGIERYVKERRWRATGLVAGAFVAGWAQQGGTGWWWSSWLLKFFREVLFYRFLYPRINAAAVGYDCGDLPSLPPPLPSCDGKESKSNMSKIKTKKMIRED